MALRDAAISINTIVVLRLSSLQSEIPKTSTFQIFQENSRTGTTPLKPKHCFISRSLVFILPCQTCVSTNPFVLMNLSKMASWSSFTILTARMTYISYYFTFLFVIAVSNCSVFSAVESILPLMEIILVSQHFSSFVLDMCIIKSVLMLVIQST